MILFLLGLLFFYGLFIGSFLNVVIDRLPRNEGIVCGNSHCEYCGHTLVWYDLVPLLSYLFLAGKCRYCKKFIGFRYPIIECTTGILFAIVGGAFTGIPSLVLMLAIASCLCVLFFIDLFDGILPDSVLVVLSGFAIVQKLFLAEHIIFFLLVGFLTGIGFLALFLLTRKKGIGFGDVKYAFVMGFLLGFPSIIPALYIAFLTGATVALILVVGGKKKLKSSIPFGPFLVLGTFVNLLWGQQLWVLFQKIVGI